MQNLLKKLLSLEQKVSEKTNKISVLSIFENPVDKKTYLMYDDGFGFSVAQEIDLGEDAFFYKYKKEKLRNVEFTPEVIIELGENEIFVFGSNLVGTHAGGAARIAHEQFGAIWGQSFGLQGKSYAIPTLTGDFEKLSLATIKNYLKKFMEYAKLAENKKFYMTKIGCGIAGFSVDEIAELFQDMEIPKNVILPVEFYPV